MLLPMIVFTFAVLSAVFFISLGVSRSKDSSRYSWNDTECTYNAFGIISLIILVVSSIVWGGGYLSRWDMQREIESFVASKTYLEYQRLIESSESSVNISDMGLPDIQIADLTPMSEALREWYRDINKYNRFIQIYNRDNASWWFDWHTPDWDAPELIIFSQHIEAIER